VKNDEIRRRTGATDVIERVTKQKWKWAGHVAKILGLWTKEILERRPRTKELHEIGSKRHKTGTNGRHWKKP